MSACKVLPFENRFKNLKIQLLKLLNYPFDGSCDGFRLFFLDLSHGEWFYAIFLPFAYPFDYRAPIC